MVKWTGCAGGLVFGSVLGLAACAAEPAGTAGSGGFSGFAGVGGGAGNLGTGGAGGAGTGGWSGSAAGWGGVGGGLGGFGGYGGDAGASGTGGDGVGGDGCIPGQFCAPRNPDSDDCGSLTLNAEVEETVTPGNLLVVFDRSGSMGDAWGTMGPKWTAASQALVTALTPVADRLTVGAVMFPTTACIFVDPGSVAPVTDPRQINFAAGPQFLQNWNAYWSTNALATGTPVQMAFDAAEASLASANLPGTTAVVLFTDGEPTDGFLCALGQMTGPDRAAQWLARGIRTYVVGLPGATGVQVLRDIANRGGTMDYITPDDPAALSQRLAAIASSTISVGFNDCSITLNPAAEVPEDLQLVVTENGVELGVERNLGAGGGWSVSSDGSQVEIFGELCEEAKRGRFSSIKFKFGCVDLPPLPPPIPPE